MKPLRYQNVGAAVREARVVLEEAAARGNASARAALDHLDAFAQAYYEARKLDLAAVLVPRPGTCLVRFGSYVYRWPVVRATSRRVYCVSPRGLKVPFDARTGRCAMEGGNYASGVLDNVERRSVLAAAGVSPWAEGFGS